MNSEAFAAWASLYDDSLGDIFVSEQKELKRVAMILSALKQEFSRIESGLEKKFVDVKRRLSSENKTATGITTTKEKVKLQDTATAAIDLCSPEESSENFELPCSLNLMKPGVGAIKTKVQQNLETKTNTAFHGQKDRSVHRKKKTSNGSSSKYSPLTQASSSNRQDNVNKKENRCTDESEKTPEQPKQFPYKTEIVRGKARLQLPGWSCKECEEFYEAMDLSPETKKAKMNACSKHRSRFKPIADTPKGFWDLTFPPTPNTEFR